MNIDKFIKRFNGIKENEFTKCLGEGPTENGNTLNIYSGTLLVTGISTGIYVIGPNWNPPAKVVAEKIEDALTVDSTPERYGGC